MQDAAAPLALPFGQGRAGGTVPRRGRDRFRIVHLGHLLPVVRPGRVSGTRAGRGANHLIRPFRRRYLPVDSTHV
ncbi:hypothetical protein SVIOM342S_02034 [Streptomyces violaceorubidus]